MPCYGPVDVAVKRLPLRPGGRRVLDTVTVGCGHCLGCRADQGRQWAIRIMHESLMHQYSWFVTLTYNDGALPPHGSLDPDDLRAFFKALRKGRKGPVRYYACGEYGETTGRPHYHAVLFGPAFLDRVEHRRDESGRPVFRSAQLERCWKHGHAEFAGVTFGSASYCAAYARKKVRRADDPDHYLRPDLETGELHELVPEFARMSLRPAIGRAWIERYWRDVYPRDFVVLEGRESKPPRYYDKWMDQDHSSTARAEICARAGGCKVHQEMMVGVREKRYAEAVERTPEELLAAHKTHRARVSLFNPRDGV